MAQVLLYRDGFLPGDGRTEYSITEYNWDTVSNTVQVIYYDSEAYTPYSRPFSSVVDTDAVGELTRYTYHNGNGTVRFQDVAPPPPPAPVDPLTMSGQVQNVSTYGQTDGAITIFVSGGTGPYSYAWTDGPTTQNRSGLPAGSYQVKATDAGGRFVEKSFQVLEGSLISDRPHLSVSLPATGVFTHSPVVLTVSSDQIGAATKAMAYLFGLPQVVPAGSRIIIARQAFTAGDIPDSETFDRLNARDSLVSLFNNTPAVNYKYRAVAGSVSDPGGQDLTIIALKAGNRYTPDVDMSGFPAPPAQITAGTDAYRGDSKKNYGVMLQLLAGFTGNFNVPTADNASELEEVAVLQRNYQPSNEYVFDVSGVLRRLARTFLPDARIAQMQYNPHSNLTWSCRLVEMYSQGESNYRETFLCYQTPLIKALPGVLPQGVENSLTPYARFVEAPARPLSGSGAIASGPQGPLANKPVPWDGVEYFSFIFDFANQAGLSIGAFHLLPLHLRVVLYLRDGTEQVINSDSVATYSGGVWVRRVDPQALGLYPPQVGDVDYYTVQPFIGTVPITVPASYQPFEAEHTVTRVVFLSDLGVFETFGFAGQLSRKMERAATSFTRTLPARPTAQDAYEQTRDVSVRELTTYYSHAVTREVFEWLKGLLKSPKVYVLDANYLPLPVTVVDFVWEDDSLTQLYSVAVTLKAHRAEAALTL